MKRMGYYPALICLLSLCGLGVGAFGYLASQTWKKISNYKSSDEQYRASQKELEAVKAAQKENEKTNETYRDYLERWAQKEGRLDEAKLKQALLKIAESSGVQIFETVPLGTPEKEEAPAAAQRGNNPRRSRVARVVAEPKPEGLVELRMVLIGPFGGLMSWMTKAEAQLGGLRIVRATWSARSPEEVKLTVGLRYKTIGEGL